MTYREYHNRLAELVALLNAGILTGREVEDIVKGMGPAPKSPSNWRWQ